MADLVASISATRSTREGRKPLIFPGKAQILISVGEVVSLEGGNQEGKSTIVKTLVGAHKPRSLRRLRGPGHHSVDVSCAMLLENKRYEPRSVNEALSQGIAAVFQDDRLIRTMTVSEQLILRHAYARRWGWLRNRIWDLVRPPLAGIPERLPAGTPFKDQMDAWAKGLPSEKRRPREVRQQAKELLESFDVEGGEPFANILDKFPDEISGGARAIVRLVSALMEPRLRILVLDEAFSGIDQRIWITALERLRDRVNKNEIGILFVSHMAAERSRWQPTRRYRLEAGSLTQQPDVPGTTFTLQAPPRPERDIICFERNTASSNQIPEFLVSSFFKTPYAIIADSNVTSTESFLELRGALAAKTIGDLPLLEISVTESTKSLTQVELVLSFLASTIKQDEGTIFCVGGGTLLNSAGLAAALFLRGRVPTVYVPTTATAIADVAIGSKTGVNRQSGISHLKHLIGTHFDPSGIFLDSRYLNGQSRVTSVESLAEIVKHGIVQDEALLNEAIALCKQTKISPEDIYRLARSTLFLKQEVLLEDLPEKAIGRILQYGHLHAHSLERALAFEISHNRSVWCGIFLDLYLGGKCIETSVLKKLLDAVSTVIKEDLGGVQIPDDRTLRRAYELETKRETRGLDGGYQIVTIDSPGCYADPERKKISTMEVPWLDVAAAWSLLRS